jgi:uncharacterized protein (DUF1800 family)
MNTETHPWAPYEPTVDDPWDLRKVAHLHRRAGFGGSWKELERDLAAGPAASIERFLRPEPESPQFRQVAAALRRAAEPSYRDSYATDPRGIASWWLYRMTYGPDPLGEKLALMWHNHFATGLHAVYRIKMMLKQNDLFRQHARGNFGELLQAVEADPAMLRWLDGGNNQKQKPNENFARELLELFTLGVGNFNEEDVREAARGLTGRRPGRDDLRNETGEFIEDESLVDTGHKKFLGEEGPWRREDILRIVLAHPATAEQVCRRLYRSFVSESEPADDALTRPLAGEFRASNYSIEHVIGIILRSRHFFSQAAYRRRVKSPVEFCVGTIRQLEPARSPNLLTQAADSCQRQGQILFDPPSVKGWDGGTAWLTSASILARVAWAVDLVTGNQSAAIPPYNPHAWCQERGVAASAAFDVYFKTLLQEDVDARTRDLARKLAAEERPRGLATALQVLLQAPEYQLA